MSEGLGQFGAYEVRLGGDDGYIVVNTTTQVVEHSTRVLFEAIRIAKIFDNELTRVKDFDPKKGFPNETALSKAALQ